MLGTAKASEVGGSVREHVDQIGYMIVYESYESYEYIMYNIRMYIYMCVWFLPCYNSGAMTAVMF